MTTKEIKLNYVSIERFLSDYAELCRGKIFLPLKAPWPENTRVALHIFIPVIEKTVTVGGTVIQAIDAQAAASLQKPSGMLVGLDGSPAAALNELNYILSTYDDYRDLLDLAPPDTYSRKKVKTAQEPTANYWKPPEVGLPDAFAAESGPLVDDDKRKTSTAVRAQAGRLPEEKQPADSTPVPDATDIASESNSEENDALSMQWIRRAIAQEEATREIEAAVQIAAAPTAVKQQLTEEERNRVKPAGEFLMDLTKAMLRSGYYASDHP